MTDINSEIIYVYLNNKTRTLETMFAGHTKQYQNIKEMAYFFLTFQSLYKDVSITYSNPDGSSHGFTPRQLRKLEKMLIENS